MEQEIRSADHHVASVWPGSSPHIPHDHNVFDSKRGLLEDSQYICEFRLAAFARAFDELIMERAMWSRETLELRKNSCASECEIDSLKVDIARKESKNQKSPAIELKADKLQPLMEKLDMANKELRIARDNSMETQVTLLNTQIELSELEDAHKELRQSLSKCETELEILRSDRKSLEYELKQGSDTDLSELKAKELQIGMISALEEAQEARAEYEKTSQQNQVLKERSDILLSFLYDALESTVSLRNVLGRMSTRTGAKDSCPRDPTARIDETSAIQTARQIVKKYLIKCNVTVHLVQASLQDISDHATPKIKELVNICRKSLSDIDPDVQGVCHDNYS